MKKRLYASSQHAIKAQQLIEGIQLYFVERLNQLSTDFGENSPFIPVEWFRHSGKNGGGLRYVSQDDSVFNRAQVNFSQVQYENDETKSLNSATAISTIIHPFNPHAPSMHMHISYSELKDNTAYWRIMADLNPSIIYQEDADTFKAMLVDSSKSFFTEGYEQGNKYFYIPVLGRHRGVEHFYLEGFNRQGFAQDSQLAKTIGKATIDTYIHLVRQRINFDFNSDDLTSQLAYHTLYLLQVLTLDRGTTSGLLIHNENDVGILGSIPSHIDLNLLSTWIEKMPEPQNLLLSNICDALDKGINKNGKVLVDDKMKQSLCDVSRKHYQQHPEALSMQASGNIIPPTVKNHQ